MFVPSVVLILVGAHSCPAANSWGQGCLECLIWASKLFEFFVRPSGGSSSWSSSSSSGSLINCSTERSANCSTERSALDHPGMPLRNGPLVRRSLALFSALGYYCLIENTIAVLIMNIVLVGT